MLSGGPSEREIGIRRYKKEYKYNVKWNECVGNSSSCSPELEFIFPEVVNSIKIDIISKSPKRVKVKVNRVWHGSSAEDVVSATEMNAKYPQT
nr:hypothetical transcript [Hymenolepis microstoma]